MPLPDGWTRKINPGGIYEGLWIGSVEYAHGKQPLSIQGLWLGVDVDTGEVPGRFSSEIEVDSFFNVFRRAWRQHEHIKSGSAEPLSEEDEVQSPAPALSMAHACACAVCPECSMGLDLIAPDDPDTSTALVGTFIGYRHRLADGKVVKCLASAIHRLIGTKA